MYINHRQNNWAKWLATAEFAFNNKVHTATKISPFQVNYERELRMGFDIRKKRRNEKAEEFVREMKERHEEARAVLVKSQEEMKRQADRSRKETEEYKIGNRVLISTKDFSAELMKKAMKKLTEKFIGPCGRKDCVRECSRVGVTGIIKNTPRSQCKENSEVSRTSRRAEEDPTASC